MFTAHSILSPSPTRRPFLQQKRIWLALASTLLVQMSCGKRPVTLAPTNPPDPSATTVESEVTVELDETQKATLRSQAQVDLEEAEAILRALDRENLSAEQREKLHSVEGLLLAARAAGEKDDVTAMANLARKARLLANELMPG